jgi:hypothetical protein
MNFTRSFSPQNAVMFFVCILEQTASVAMCSCNGLVGYKRDGECLLCSTYWVFKSNRLLFGAAAPIGPGPHTRGSTITLRHTTLGRASLNK